MYKKSCVARVIAIQISLKQSSKMKLLRKAENCSVTGKTIL